MSAIDELASKRRRGALLLALGLCMAGASQAGLDERADSVGRDHAASQGLERRVTPMANFELQLLQIQAVHPQVHGARAEHAPNVSCRA